MMSASHNIISDDVMPGRLDFPETLSDETFRSYQTRPRHSVMKRRLDFLKDRRSTRSPYLLRAYATIGWLRSVGSIQKYVSFAEYSLFYRAPLQKNPIISSILPTEATP